MNDENGRRPGPAGWMSRMMSRVFGPMEESLPESRENIYLAGNALPLLAPPMDQAQRIIEEYIDHLVRTDSLDEGSSHVLDDTIQSWVRQWDAAAESTHKSRRGLLLIWQKLAAQERMNCERRIAKIDAELAMLDRELNVVEISVIEARPADLREALADKEVIEIKPEPHAVMIPIVVSPTPPSAGSTDSVDYEFTPPDGPAQRQQSRTDSVDYQETPIPGYEPALPPDGVEEKP